MSFIKTIMLSILLLQLTFVKAQVWIGSLPMYYNPSFAGSTDKLRLSSYFSYRNVSFSRGDKDYLGHNGISADGFIPQISTGIGINLSYFSTRDAVHMYNAPGHSMEAELIAAPKISIKGKYTISPSISINYLMNNDRNGLPIWDNQGGLYKSSRLHSRAGIMLQNKRFYLGYSTEFENNDLRSDYDPFAYFESRKSLRGDIPQKYYFNYSSVQTGYSFCLSANENMSLTPQVLWFFSHGNASANQLAPNTLNLTFRANKFLSGIGYNQVLAGRFYSIRNYTLMLGYQSEKFRMMLTRDFQPIGTTELFNDFHLSLRYLIGSNNNNPSVAE
jgi:hypothetical protein